MMQYHFPLCPFIHATLAGHFIAPSSNWKHMSRPLGEYELMYVLEGTLYIARDDTSYEVHPGEYVLIPPTSHQYGTKSSACSFYWLHFSADESDCATKNLTLPASASLPHPARFSVLFSQFCNQAKTYNDSYTIDHFATGLLLELAQQLQENTSSKERSGYELYKKILDYMEWNSGYNLRVEQIARYLGYHPKYISSVFHRFHPEPLKQHLLKCVMEHAKSELSFSSKKISEIAEEMGFSDVHHFSSSFRRIVGVSPGKYRQQFPEGNANLY